MPQARTIPLSPLPGPRKYTYSRSDSNLLVFVHIPQANEARLSKGVAHMGCSGELHSPAQYSPPASHPEALPSEGAQPRNPQSRGLTTVNITPGLLLGAGIVRRAQD